MNRCGGHVAGKRANPRRDPLVVCHGEFRRSGSVKGVGREKCRECGYQRAVGRPNRGPIFVTSETRETVAALLAQGHSLNHVHAQTGISRATARRIRESLPPVVCECGRPATHKGWCPWRWSNSPARQVYGCSPGSIPARPRSPKTPRHEFYPFLLAAGGDGVDLLLQVCNIVPRAMSEQMRADICQEAVLAVLTGEVSIEELRGGALRKIVTRYHRRYHDSIFACVPLDAPLFGDGRTLAEVLPDLRDAA